MTTPPNPQQLLRRPKKPVAHNSHTGLIAAVAGGALLIVGSIIGFVVFAHGKSAASSTPQVTTAQVASMPAEQSFAGQNLQPRGKHGTGRPVPVVKPSPGASPTAAPTATPDASPTPADTHPKTAAEIAKAKHQAALRLAALRKQQTGGQSTDSTGLLGQTVANTNTSTRSTVTQTPQPIATEAATPAPAVATPDAAPTPVYAPRVVVDARFVDRVSPAYPDIAKEQGAQGTAIVLVTVGPKGNVISVQIDQSTGNKLLDQSALSAARSSRFEPPEIDGKPATETYRIVYTFDPSM